MSVNCYTTCGCTGEILLPSLPTSYRSELPPLLSQVSGLLILPKGAQGPASWVVASNITDIIDNTVTDNSAGKWLVGRGRIPKPEEVIINLGKIHREIESRIYALTFEVNIRCNEIYAFLQTIQKNYTAFDFWYNTRGGRLFGGPNGLCPEFVTGWTEYSEDANGVERGFIQIVWRSCMDPLRTLLSIDLDSEGSPGTPTIANVMFYQQSFPLASSSTLAWTTNSGVLPSTNEAAQIWVFQNGQKLENTVQYSVSHLTGPGESEININALTHYAGANYEVIAVTTA